MRDFSFLARKVLQRCEMVATFSEEAGRITRTYLSEPMWALYREVASWMQEAGMVAGVDPAGNLVGRYPARTPNAPTLIIGSHLDTVPNAGRYDGVLGVLLGLALVETLEGRHLSYALDVVGFGDEEGVRFGVPFLGSRGFIGDFPEAWLSLTDARGATLAETLRRRGLDPARVGEAAFRGRGLGYLEIHIEQGPVLDEAGVPLGVVEGIVGLSRIEVIFRGRAAHAGTTPMAARRDALCGAAAFVLATEARARQTPGLVATVGRLQVTPGADNVVPGAVKLAVDLRHQTDAVRCGAWEALADEAWRIARSRALDWSWQVLSEVEAVHLDPGLIGMLEAAVQDAGLPVHRLLSGAGHDAMVVGRVMPAAMLFLRSPGGISHHPDEEVEMEDVAAALRVGVRFLELLEERGR